MDPTAKTSSAVPYASLDRIPTLDDLTAQLSQYRQDGKKVNFICYDIAMLRRVNYAYGHAAGDALLLAVANWTCGFPGMALYRVEGGFFCLMCAGAACGDVMQFAKDIQARFAMPWYLRANCKSIDVFTNVSIAAIEDDEDYWAQNVFDMFERALDFARESGEVAIFNSSMDLLTRKHIQMQIDLKACILQNMLGFEVVYQPISSPTAGIWQGLEALCRWTSPSLEPVSPAVFIPEAENMGLIHFVGEWVLDTATKTCIEMGLVKVPRFFLSVNVSATQIVKPGFAENVLSICQKNQFPNNKLVLEITESTQFVFNENAYNTIQNLRRKGVRFALDDFGTGYSGFCNLKGLPIDILKTDAEFIRDIENDTYLQFFYYIMSEAAHSNQIKLIAEGVEDRRQLQSVVKNGADLVQGFLFSKPLDTRTLRTRRENFLRSMPDFHVLKPDIVDMKQWLRSQDAYKITPALFGLQSQCMSIILNEDNLDLAFTKVLGCVGQYFKVNRAYVFLQDEASIFSNKYEWCAPNVESQMYLFQRVDIEKDGFYEVLRTNEVVIATKETELPEDLQNRLAVGEQENSIAAMVVLPMKRGNEIIGFVGMDDARPREWMPEEMIMLQNLCLLSLIVLVRNGETPTCKKPGLKRATEERSA